MLAIVPLPNMLSHSYFVGRILPLVIVSSNEQNFLVLISSHFGLFMVGSSFALPKKSR